MPLRPRTVTARKLRRNSTDVERLLWRALRESNPSLKFRRQHPIGRHIADFACPARKLGIELVGGQHAEQASADAARTAELARHGIASSGSGTATFSAISRESWSRYGRNLNAPPLPNPLRPQGAEREHSSWTHPSISHKNTAWKAQQTLQAARPPFTAICAAGSKIGRAS